MAEKGRPLPKFGEWDVNDPASAEGFTVIFNKARNEKKGGGNDDSPAKYDLGHNKHGEVLGKAQSLLVITCRENGYVVYKPLGQNNRESSFLRLCLSINTKPPKL